MESAVESVADQQPIDNIKSNETSDKPTVKEDLCHKSNGVADAANVVPDSSGGDKVEELVKDIEGDGNDVVDSLQDTEGADIVSASEVELCKTEDFNVNEVTQVAPAESTQGSELVESELIDNVSNTAEMVESVVDSNTKNCVVNDVQMEEVVESEIIEPANDNVRFETEILVETNETDINEIEIQDAKEENDSPNNILNELGQNIELSEVLRSSDVSENVENNNCPIRQEVFNKEELLDILEGNDVQPSGNQVADILEQANKLEAELALEQLSRLKNNRRPRITSDTPRKKSSQVVSVQKEKKEENIVQKEKKEDNVVQKQKKEENIAQKQKKEENIVHKQKKEENIVQKQKKEENIVNALVKDWDDDEPADENPKSEEPSSKSEQNNENIEIKEESTADSSTGDGQTPDLIKNSDDGQPQRRLGRVIKKKVIFDPDNPDTFTKSKSLKNKESDIQKDEHPPKKAKLEQAAIRAKSKSPVSKMQWKKPPPKNSKQNKRLTEVDKLLMDEGAVNMIYQLTPEAPKGKKNMKTKAEFIKKLQSSTPECKEMKFRERKKESLKNEEGEAKRILGGKQRSSLSSSVKSPSVSEDFETHSADDSIIYRRHSSSSYSSSCMSPRRLSDVETNQGTLNSSQLQNQTDASCGDVEPAADVFQPDSSISTEIINKDDCLSIKKKLNSKLSLALNKRKRESVKTDKPIKKKLLMKTDDEQETKGQIDNFKHLSLTFDQRVAEICIRKSGSKYNIEVLKEMEEALYYVDTRKDISLTLLISECGGLCSDLDLTSLLDSQIEKRTTSAELIAESVRSLLVCVERHSKVVCCGVWARCAGVALALLALSDVALAAERAHFALRPPLPGPVRALAASARRLPQNLINDLVIFGRELSAAEALQSGLVNRVLWPGGVVDQIRVIARDIAAQPPLALQLKKKMLNIGKTPESTFLSQLESEEALMVEYWTSDEGQEAIRADAGAV